MFELTAATVAPALVQSVQNHFQRTHLKKQLEDEKTAALMALGEQEKFQYQQLKMQLEEQKNILAMHQQSLELSIQECTRQGIPTQNIQQQLQELEKTKSALQLAYTNACHEVLINTRQLQQQINSHVKQQYRQHAAATLPWVAFQFDAASNIQPNPMPPMIAQENAPDRGLYFTPHSTPAGSSSAPPICMRVLATRPPLNR